MTSTDQTTTQFGARDAQPSVIHVQRAVVDEQIATLQRLLEDKRALPTIEDVANVRGQIASLRLVLRNFAPGERRATATTQFVDLSKPLPEGPGLYAGT